ncbi:MAG TPA: tetratricopeptide repeat protein, partial [Fimbriimonadaceae bacterium]|nr:tetratricopeptide repeat protein [Fimbriimonadaceae bacterium]
MALIESASEITRDKVIERLQTTLPLMEVALPPRRSPEEIVEFIGEARKKAAGRVLSVTGWETALPTDRPLAGSLGIINFSRERMLEGEPRQIWWMNPSFKNAFMHYARDTFSWFMLRLRLTELPEPAIEHSRPEPVRPSTGEEERIRKDAEFAIRHAVAAIRRGDVESAIDSVVPPLWDLWTIDHNADILKHADSLDAAIAASTGYPSVADWIRERSRHASPDGISRHVAFLRILGMARYESGAVDDGKLLVEESLGLARRRTEAEISVDSLRDLSISLDNVGNVRLDAGQLAEAIAAYEESLQIGRDILRDYGRSLQALRDLSVSLNNVGRVRLDAGQLAEAITAYEESLQI